MDLQPRVEALENEVERLRQRCSELEAIAFGGWVPPVEWGLTASEQRLLAVLARREGFTPKAVLLTALAYGREKVGLVENSVEIHISKLRRKIAPYGCQIVTERWQGYRLTPAARARLLSVGAEARL